jgi:UDP-2-acetamido-2,6-beta-L-arabino-hexul-4-ose reductase
MKTVLVTGAKGFLGRNLTARLKLRADVRLLTHELDDAAEELPRRAAAADVVFHLAGVNRPRDPVEYAAGNAGSAAELCRALARRAAPPQIIFSSSIQAELDNPYGRSKRAAEAIFRRFARRSGALLAVFRLKNLFGKWCRPNYNSVTATFCHNIARGLPITISDPTQEISLSHVDDVTAAMLAEMDLPGHHPRCIVAADRIPSRTITLGELAERILAFRDMRRTLRLPDFSDRFNRQLYGTYMSYLEPEQAEYGLEALRDRRGSLAELLKSAGGGQIFVSRTAPGVTRGNHYHHLKAEKFIVLAGEGLIRLRQVESDEIHEYRVRGEDYRVVDILPGFVHSITNIGQDDLVTLFWSDEIFDPARADTHPMPVDINASQAIA